MRTNNYKLFTCNRCNTQFYDCDFMFVYSTILCKKCREKEDKHA